MKLFYLEIYHQWLVATKLESVKLMQHLNGNDYEYELPRARPRAVKTHTLKFWL